MYIPRIAISLVLYALYGAMLSAVGVSVLDKPVQFIIMMFFAIAFELLGAKRDQ